MCTARLSEIRVNIHRSAMIVHTTLYILFGISHAFAIHNTTVSEAVIRKNHKLYYQEVLVLINCREKNFVLSFIVYHLLLPGTRICISIITL
jgi:hypothetical protein